MTNLDSILKSRDITFPTKLHLVKAEQLTLSYQRTTVSQEKYTSVIVWTANWGFVFFFLTKHVLFERMTAIQTIQILYWKICRIHWTMTFKMTHTWPLEPVDESERGEWKSWLKTHHSKNQDHDIRSHHFMANRWGTNGNSERLYILGLQNHCGHWLQPWN